MEINTSINSSDLKTPLIINEEDEELGQQSVASTTSTLAQKRSLGFGALVFLIYYNIGVPFGDEEVRLSLPLASVFSSALASASPTPDCQDIPVDRGPGL